MTIASLVTRSFFGGITGLVLHGLQPGIATNVTDTHDIHLSKRHRDRLKRQAKLAEDAIYRNVPRPILKLKTPTLPMDLRTEPFIPEVTVAPYIYDMGRMPLANPIQWLLDDDEEAIGWLLQ